MTIAVFSCSLHTHSRSRVLAQRVVEELLALGVAAPFHDLRDYDLPFCGSPDAWSAPDVPRAAEAVRQADGILLAAPVYNFDLNAAAKNLVELTGRNWSDKPVGFLCAAGGKSSYMAPMAFANSLMLDFRCLIVPRFVYVGGAAFDNDRTAEMSLASPEIAERLAGLAAAMVRLVRGLALTADG